ncbi:MAG: leucine-rich repeat protein, partial [Anaerotignum sp.]|nr:leucine-rich repeat protein [Anaerotignum sp.]
YVFGWLPNLKEADLGTVQFIDYAFYNCDGLKEIVLPSSLNAIGAESFRNCINLRKVEILGDDAEIRWDAFLGANRLEEVYCGKRTWVNEEWGSGSPGFSKKATLYVYNRSDMHRFAEGNGYSFEFIENEWR